MMRETMFTGTGGKIVAIEKKSMQYTFFAGVIMIGIYLMYEIYKASFILNSDITVFIDYPVESIFLRVADYMLASIVVLALILLVAGIVMVVASKVDNIITLKVACISLVVMLLVSGILASLRIIADMTILLIGCEDPVNAWMYRYYTGEMVLVAEWKVIPDILLNGILIAGIVLMGFSVADFFGTVNTYYDIMTRGMKTGDESVVIHGKKQTVSCKELGGVKACKLT